MKFDEYEKELLELDEKGLIKSEAPSIEHAKLNAMLSEFSLQEITSKSA